MYNIQHSTKINFKNPLGLDIVKQMYNIQHVIMRAISSLVSCPELLA
jgi:hypothetical protein